MCCCIERNANNNPQTSPAEVKRKLDKIDSQQSMVAIFTSVIASEPERAMLRHHFEQQHSPELPYYIEDFINWKNAPSREGAETLYNKYFGPDSQFPIDVQNGDERRIKFLLSSYNTNVGLIHDMFMKYAMSSTKDIKNSYNPKL